MRRPSWETKAGANHPMPTFGPTPASGRPPARAGGAPGEGANVENMSGALRVILASFDKDDAYLFRDH